MRVRVLSSLALFLTLGALEAIFLGLIVLLAVVIPSAAAVLILVYRYQGRLVELENSDQARWEE